VFERNQQSINFLGVSLPLCLINYRVLEVDVLVELLLLTFLSWEFILRCVGIEYIKYFVFG
jgi:hypothetical protein